MSPEQSLAKLNKLNKARNNAPHKPFLLLVVLELAERDSLPAETFFLTPDVSYRFDTFAAVVAHRRTRHPDLRMPFHHLRTDGFWEAFTTGGHRSKHRSVTEYVVLHPDFLEACQSEEFINTARRILIAAHFEPAERNALYHLVGMEIPADDEIAADASFEVPDDAENVGRNGRFRVDVVAAYNFTCALTGYRVTTIGSGAIVDAAHIHQFADSRNNDPRNGLALCKNAHWLFDIGLWSIDADYRIVVATGAFSESSPDQKPLAEYSGERLRLPAEERLWPDPAHCRWHRRKKFRL